MASVLTLLTVDSDALVAEGAQLLSAACQTII